MSDQKKKFYAARIYRAADNKFYGVVEGNLTRDVTLAEGPKAKYVMNGLASGENDFAMMARKAGMQIPDEVEIKTFLNLSVFGKLAEDFAKHTQKGTRVFVAGQVTYNNEYKNLSLTVDEFIAHPGFEDQFIGNGIARFTSEYTTRAGDTRHEPTVALIPGKVTWIGDLNDGGKTPIKHIAIESTFNPELVFDLAQGTYSKDKKYDTSAGGKFSVTAFGRTAERLEKIVKKEMVLAVTGRLSKDSNEETGKVYYNLTADDFSVVKWPPREDGNTNAAPAEPKRNKAPKAEPAAPAADDGFAEIGDEDEGDLPF